MRKRLLLAALMLVVLQVFFLTASRSERPACSRNKPATLGQQNPPAADAERERLLAMGRKIFVEHCGSCHDERGNKPLRTGPPLNARNLTREEIERGAGGRLRGKTGEEKLAVALYIENFMKK